MKRTTRFLFAGCMALACMLSWSTRTMAQGGYASLAIDPDQSFLSILIGLVDDSDPEEPVFIPIATPQQPGSDTATLSGSLTAQFLYGQIRFPGGSNIVFDDFPDGPLEPLPDGSLPGSAPANYGLDLDLDGFVFGPGAVRDALADVTRPFTDIIGGNSFDSSGVLLSLTNGDLAVNLDGFAQVVEVVDISGNSALNQDAGGILDINGLEVTLTMPTYVEVVVPVEIVEGFFLPVTAIFEGQIVATGIIPEPSSFALAGFGLIAVAGAGYRRFRRKMAS